MRASWEKSQWFGLGDQGGVRGEPCRVGQFGDPQSVLELVDRRVVGGPVGLGSTDHPGMEGGA